MTLSQLIKNPTHFLAFGLGSGLITPAPGTWGTLAAVVLFLPFQQWLIGSWFGVLLLLASFIIGIYLCGQTAKDLGVHDFSGIVWDEFVGVWLVLVCLPPSLLAHWGLWWCALAAFILFRFFDIVKPPPIHWLDQRVPGGLGIMIDDVLAGIFALIVLWLSAELFY
ncbi:phosphatidylglycerophosphatase A [Suttonella sp. R2A3]|uniref:phosphatidylglycerophosphatase A family protein n=1 Tax=Suttonella sp. R2A3 TaxID=2908648 RepID=UPI001F26B9B2|nr:phosphatidylglycerophosphatase A [Suttonella sp. R2A3]UJF24931.1 phosphatidylglycerophosphatase A [Suttonella sp. R2A3]